MYCRYGIVTEEAKALHVQGTRRTGAPAVDFSTLSSGLFSIVWRRVSLDEAHYINNRDTQSAHAVAKLRAETRWCITGPLTRSAQTGQTTTTTTTTSTLHEVAPVPCTYFHLFVKLLMLTYRHSNSKLPGRSLSTFALPAA